jgi:hypothetical protein
MIGPATLKVLTSIELLDGNQHCSGGGEERV